MRRLQLIGALVAAAGALLVAAPAGATSGPPTVTGITTQCSGGDKVCADVTVDSPAAGTITLMLTGHTPSSSVFVDTGLHVTITVDADHTDYQACFDNVSSVIQGMGFNTLRVEIFSSTVPGLEGTTTKSQSFEPCGEGTPTPTPSPSPSASPSPSPSPSSSPSPSPSGSPNPSPSPSASPSPGGSPTPTSAPSPTPSAAVGGAGLALTGGFDGRFPLIGLPLLVLGITLLLVTSRRRRRTGRG